MFSLTIYSIQKSSPQRDTSIYTFCCHAVNLSVHHSATATLQVGSYCIYEKYMTNSSINYTYFKAFMFVFHMRSEDTQHCTVVPSIRLYTQWVSQCLVEKPCEITPHMVFGDEEKHLRSEVKHIYIYTIQKNVVQ